MKYIKIHKEGKWIFAFTLLLLLVLNVIVYMQFQKPFLAINITLSAFLLIFVMFFFRNPRRVVEIDDPSLIVAPADGTVVVIETPSHTQILVRQIAGALARRIVTYAHVGKACHLNEHIGFIKFGSRVDVFLPLDAEIFVEIGESTTGNETIIARLNED